jgi:hypothetical protein
MASSSLPTDVYTSGLATSEHPQFAPPTSSSASPFKESPRRSPAKTIRAAKATPDLDEYRKLLRSASVTTAEKELASRVVEAAEKLRSWCSQIEQWGWSGCFDSSVAGSRSLADGAASFHEVRQYCTSLPQKQVERYESHLDAIDEELAAMDVDELKEHVLGIHVGRSRPASSYSTQSMATLTLMDDFQLFVTETLIQTLPHHAKLKQYLRAWSMRLAVFDKIPKLLETMSAFGTQMNQAYRPLQYPLGPLLPVSEMHRLQAELEHTRSILNNHIVEGGRLLDSMLDILEGSDDRLPEQWVDRFEKDEKEYTDWSVHADRQLFKIRMLAEAVPLTEERLFVPPLPAPGFGETAVLAHNQESTLPNAAPESSKPAEHSSEEESHQADDREITTSSLDADEGDSQATTVHHPTCPVTVLPLMLPVEPVREQESEPVTASPRNSTSTIASQVRPESRGKASSGPSSPNDEIKRPLSWDTQASSPGNTSIATTSAAAAETVDDRPVTPILGTPSKRQGSVSSIASSMTSASKDLADESPSLRASTRYLANAPRPPLNFAMKKRRGENVAVTDTSRYFSTPFPDMENLNISSSPQSSPTKTSNSPRSPAMPLEEQISNILDSIPAPIRLTAGPSANSTEIKTRHNRQPRSRAATPSLQTVPTLTLAPAEEATTRKPGANDPDIKLYHLSQPGKDKPLKLFIRRVGENGERVMVRVGGGWADLGEYLRGYAEHHGRRTASDGRVEVFGLVGDPATSPVVAPTGRRASLASSIGSPAVANTSLFGELSDARSPTPSFSLNNTPRVTEDNMTPRSSSAMGSQRGSPAPWEMSDVSLAGPAHRATKKGEMSEEKKQWVEDIVEQAKASVPNRKVEFGDLGKKGATRRVFLKGGKPQVE